MAAVSPITIPYEVREFLHIGLLSSELKDFLGTDNIYNLPIPDLSSSNSQYAADKIVGKNQRIGANCLRGGSIARLPPKQNVFHCNTFGNISCYARMVYEAIDSPARNGLASLLDTLSRHTKLGITDLKRIHKIEYSRLERMLSQLDGMGFVSIENDSTFLSVPAEQLLGDYGRHVWDQLKQSKFRFDLW